MTTLLAEGPDTNESKQIPAVQKPKVSALAFVSLLLCVIGLVLVRMDLRALIPIVFGYEGGYPYNEDVLFIIAFALGLVVIIQRYWTKRRFWWVALFPTSALTPFAIICGLSMIFLLFLGILDLLFFVAVKCFQLAT